MYLMNVPSTLHLTYAKISTTTENALSHIAFPGLSQLKTSDGFYDPFNSGFFIAPFPKASLGLSNGMFHMLSMTISATQYAYLKYHMGNLYT